MAARTPGSTPGGSEAAELYDATAAYAWRLALCLHPEPVAAEHAVAQAYRTLFAERGSVGQPLVPTLHRDRTRLLSVLTEQSRPIAPAGA